MQSPTIANTNAHALFLLALTLFAALSIFIAVAGRAEAVAYTWTD
jgi:hypothetical protein